MYSNLFKPLLRCYTVLKSICKMIQYDHFQPWYHVFHILFAKKISFSFVIECVGTVPYQVQYEREIYYLKKTELE